MTYIYIYIYIYIYNVEVPYSSKCVISKTGFPNPDFFTMGLQLPHN